MRLVFILSAFVLFASNCAAQNDLLLLKKNNRTVKSFFPGSEIDFSTTSRYYEQAQITSIQKDSVFLVQYDVRQVYSPTLGVFVLDTVATYPFAVNYKEIIALGKNTKKFNWSASGTTLF